jgi:hypothetical protein
VKDRRLYGEEEIKRLLAAGRESRT